MVLQGHIREIYGVDWGVDGYRVLTSSGDGWVKCWDLRKVDCSGSTGAHKSVVSDVRWYKGGDSSHSYLPSTGAENGDAMVTDEATSAPTQRQAGTFFVSSGFDRNVNVFSADDWSLIKSLTGHSDKVLSVDISHDARWIASASHDRTVKLWGIE
jgi:U4/U6 small nuclear ribonucleoprotein PRP4